MWEVELIAKHQTTDPKHGYNYTRGGDHHGETSERLREKLRRSANPTNIQPCCCVETRKKYKSMAEAARDVGTTQSLVQRSCQSNGKYSTKGRHFIYLDPKKRKIIERNIVLKEAENWDWSW